MVDDGTLGKIFSAAAGVWTLVLMAAVALFKSWPHILGRFNERARDNANEKARDWERLRAERDHARSERDRIHGLWVECEEEKMALLSRAVTAEAALIGLGVSRQQVTILRGVEKLEGNGK